MADRPFQASEVVEDPEDRPFQALEVVVVVPHPFPALVVAEGVVAHRPFQALGEEAVGVLRRPFPHSSNRAEVVPT